MSDKIVRIGNAGGFWGDDPEALHRQVTGGKLDYITLDYLAEITMSILQKQKKSLSAKGIKGGYVSDFIKHFMSVASRLKENGTRVVTNAGGINPMSCAQALMSELEKQGLDFKIGIVEGDDIFDMVNAGAYEKDSFANMESGQPFANIKDRLESANVYIGAAPIVELLKKGADVVIAGRVTDTSLVMAPAIFEHDWVLDDWDKIASSLVAGHILECGAQATGGNHTDWQQIEKWEDFGFPIAEVHADGSFVVTKHSDSGGLVSVDTIKEQLVYEMGDPKFYISPDVVTDFTTIQLKQEDKDRVKVSGARGYPPTPFFKVSMAYQNGYTANGAIIVSDADCYAKSKTLSDTFWKRLDIDFEKKNSSFVGLDSCHGELSKRTESNEILLRFAVYDQEKWKIDKFSESLASLILTGPPGLAVTSGRPRVRSVVSYWPCLIDKKSIEIGVKMLDEDTSADIQLITGEEKVSKSESQSTTSDGKSFSPWHFDAGKKVRIVDLCLARSGDKGNMANIGVIARNGEVYEFMKSYFSAEFVKHMFSSFCKGKVVRYELDNLMALNFLLEESLDGGGTESLMIDAQGKTFAPALLNHEVEIPDTLFEQLDRKNRNAVLNFIDNK